MSSQVSPPFQDALRWLAQYAGFPARRLANRAETLVCIGALAAREEMEEQRKFALERRDPAQTSALRAHGLRRSQVHFKCDNSAKV